MRPAATILLLLIVALAAVAADDQAICAVCGPREGAGFEPVKAHATHKGKSYAFCSLKCKVEFLKNPDEFLVTDEGKPAPAFTLKTFEGKPVSLADFKGQVVLLDFWGTFCIPCVNALPELQALQAKHGARGFTVIGVVPDFPTGSVRVPVAPTAYFVDPPLFGMLSIRIQSGGMAGALAGIRNLWVATGQQGLPKILPLEQYAEGLYRDILLEGILFALAAAVALFIACIGLFGMASFMAEQRTKEIGIRKVLGATTGQIARLLLWQFSQPVLWANLIAWPIVWWLMSRWLAGFSAHVPLDPWLFLAGGAFTLLVTLATVGGQAWLVARRSPVAALRYE